MKYPNFAIGDFDLQKIIVAQGHRCYTPCGFPFAQMRLILGGSCRVLTANGQEKIPCKAGDVLYIPAQTGYELLWEKSEFYTLFFLPGLLKHNAAAMCTFSGEKLFPFFTKLECSSSAGKEFGALSSFYSLMAEAEPFITSQMQSPADAVLPAVRVLENCTDGVKVAELAKLCCLSESRFYVLFKQKTGMSPIDYRNAAKIKKAVFMLREGFGVEEISTALHFCSTAFFRREFKKFTGKTPSEFIKKQN